MKELLKGFILWVIVIGAIIGAGALVNVLAQVITMKTIITVVYIALGCGIVYIFKEA
jgi:hypothetical protein